MANNQDDKQRCICNHNFMSHTHFSFPSGAHLQSLIALAIKEDVGSGDITSNTLIPNNTHAIMDIVARDTLVIAGLPIISLILNQSSAKVEVVLPVEDGMTLPAGATLATLTGDARVLLTYERVILNFLQHMSGIATLTCRYVEAVKGTGATILDTRKTIPGWRGLEKYAVTCGGGQNHRMGLYDAVMIKDNHIALHTHIARAIEMVRSKTDKMIIVECDTLGQVIEALSAKPDRILLDNMSLELLRESVRIVAGQVALEASGGVNLENVREIAKTGVDYISIGALTHSAVAVDIGADISISS